MDDDDDDEMMSSVSLLLGDFISICDDCQPSRIGNTFDSQNNRIVALVKICPKKYKVETASQSSFRVYN